VTPRTSPWPSSRAWSFLLGEVRTRRAPAAVGRASLTNRARVFLAGARDRPDALYGRTRARACGLDGRSESIRVRVWRRLFCWREDTGAFLLSFGEYGSSFLHLRVCWIRRSGSAVERQRGTSPRGLLAAERPRAATDERIIGGGARKRAWCRILARRSSWIRELHSARPAGRSGWTPGDPRVEDHPIALGRDQPVARCRAREATAWIRANTRSSKRPPGRVYFAPRAGAGSRAQPERGLRIGLRRLLGLGDPRTGRRPQQRTKLAKPAVSLGAR